MYFPFRTRTIHIAKPEDSSRAARRSGRSSRTPRGRVPRFEQLERRQLLSITSLDLAAGASRNRRRRAAFRGAGAALHR